MQVESDEKSRFMMGYIEKHVFPRLKDPIEARKVLEYFRSSPSFGDQYLRYLETYFKLVDWLDLSGKKIAETGHLSALAAYLRDQGHDVSELGGDFRYQITAESESCDLLLCLEVLEHIKDHNSDNLSDIVLTNYSGARSFFSEMSRVVKKNGHLLLTTPNANSLVVAWRAIHNEAPWFFSPHVREYTIQQVIDLASEAGFDLEKFETQYAFFFLQDRTKLLENYFGRFGASVENRGDNSVFLFRKRDS